MNAGLIADHGAEFYLMSGVLGFKKIKNIFQVKQLS